MDDKGFVEFVQNPYILPYKDRELHNDVIASH
jgi:hypothetical protein